jgi:hypothetical protein
LFSPGRSTASHTVSSAGVEAVARPKKKWSDCGGHPKSQNGDLSRFKLSYHQQQLGKNAARAAHHGNHDISFEHESGTRMNCL